MPTNNNVNICQETYREALQSFNTFREFAPNVFFSETQIKEIIKEARERGDKRLFIGVVEMNDGLLSAVATPYKDVANNFETGAFSEFPIDGIDFSPMTVTEYLSNE